MSDNMKTATSEPVCAECACELKPKGPHYEAGYFLGEIAARSNGGSGVEGPLADLGGYTDAQKAEFMEGFNDALSRCEADDLREDNLARLL